MNRTSHMLGMTAWLISISTMGAKNPQSSQTHCPVMERYPVDKTQWIDIKGKRIYVCCKGCTNQIKANPDKYIKRLEDKGVILEKAPEKTSKTK